MPKRFSSLSSVLLLSLVLTVPLSANAQQIAQLPLGEQVQQDQSQVQEDKARLKEDSANEQHAEQGTQQYIQSTAQWIQQADAQKQQYEEKLGALESGKSKASLAKMLNTPGNQLYVLNSWLKKESALEAQAQRNLQNAQQSLTGERSALQQDEQAITYDAATAQRDKQTYRDEMNSHADLVRQAQNARWQGDFHGAHHGRFYTNYDKSAYDAGDDNP
jgi:hypothetical protein